MSDFPFPWSPAGAAIRGVIIQILKQIGIHSLVEPAEGELLLRGLTAAKLCWDAEKRPFVDPKPALLVLDPPSPAPNTPEVDAARVAFETAVIGLLTARAGLLVVDSRHALEMDVKLIRTLAGAHEVKNA